MRTSQPFSRLDRLLNPFPISVVLRPHAASFFDHQGVTTVASGSWIFAVHDGSYAWPVDGMFMAFVSVCLFCGVPPARWCGSGCRAVAHVRVAPSRRGSPGPWWLGFHPGRYPDQLSLTAH